MPLDTETRRDFKRTAICNTLRECRLFQDLTNEDLQRVADTCVLKSLEKGEFLFREHEKAQGFYVVHSGAINVHRVTPEGKEQIICIFRQGEPFAEITLTTVDTYPADAVALESSQVILIRKQEFRELIFKMPQLALQMLTSMSVHLKHLVQLLEDLKFKQIESRLAHWLLRNRRGAPCDHEHVVELTTNKRTLANQLGVTSETLSRTLARFRDEGLIQVDRRTITLLDREGLQRYLE